MRNTILYIAGAAALSVATHFLTDKADKALDTDNRSLLPRVLITFVAGGIALTIGQEYRRNLEPQYLRDVRGNLSL